MWGILVFTWHILWVVVLNKRFCGLWDGTGIEPHALEACTSTTEWLLSPTVLIASGCFRSHPHPCSLLAGPPWVGPLLVGLIRWPYGMPEIESRVSSVQGQAPSHCVIAPSVLSFDCILSWDKGLCLWLWRNSVSPCNLVDICFTFEVSLDKLLANWKLPTVSYLQWLFSF